MITFCTLCFHTKDTVGGEEHIHHTTPAQIDVRVKQKLTHTLPHHEYVYQNTAPELERKM